jgi:hypothetical protein
MGVEKGAMPTVWGVHAWPRKAVAMAPEIGATGEYDRQTPASERIPRGPDSEGC